MHLCKDVQIVLTANEIVYNICKTISNRFEADKPRQVAYFDELMKVQSPNIVPAKTLIEILVANLSKE